MRNNTLKDIIVLRRLKYFRSIKWLLPSALLVFGLVFIVVLNWPSTQSNHPNIIIILTDDHGWGDLGAHSSMGDVRTPNLDQMARDGVLFSRGYASSPQSAPSRAGLLTGRYQTRFGLEKNTDNPLPLKGKTIADRLKPAGYVTDMVGKWFLGPAQNITVLPDGPNPPGSYKPKYRGFAEYWVGVSNVYEANFALSNYRSAPWDRPLKIKDDRYKIELQTEVALAFLRRRKDEEPFFLYLFLPCATWEG